MEPAKPPERQAATVYERFDTLQVGKGYALNDLLSHIRSHHPFTYYDGYFIFDADNIVDSHFISSMDARSHRAMTF